MSINEKTRPRARDSQLVRSVAAEDLRAGDYVVLLEQMFEYPSYLWCGDAQLESRDQPVRITWMMRGGRPMRIESICLPFLLVKPIGDEHEVLDVRSCRLARPTADYVHAVRQARRAKKHKKAKKRKRKKKNA